MSRSGCLGSCDERRTVWNRKKQWQRDLPRAIHGRTERLRLINRSARRWKRSRLNSVGEEFQGRDGTKYKEILVPNPDKDDHRPWQTFVVKANHVHENQFGKGMWCKLPAEGSTTLQRSVKVGQDIQGKPIWDKEKTKVPNKELKKMVESYKERSSMREKLAEKKKEAAQIRPAEKTMDKTKSRETSL